MMIKDGRVSSLTSILVKLSVYWLIHLPRCLFRASKNYVVEKELPRIAQRTMVLCQHQSHSLSINYTTLYVPSVLLCD